MAFCNQCGAKVEDDAQFCTACGAKIDRGTQTQTPAPAAQPAQEQKKEGKGGGYEKYFAYTDTTASYKKEDIDANRIVSVLSYLHILVLVPLIAVKESPFAQYHAKLGLNLLLWHLVAEIGGGIINNILGWIPVVGGLVALLVSLINIALWCINVFGIVSAAQGKARELTILEPFKIIK